MEPSCLCVPHRGREGAGSTANSYIKLPFDNSHQSWFLDSKGQPGPAAAGAGGGWEVAELGNSIRVLTPRKASQGLPQGLAGWLTGCLLVNPRLQPVRVMTSLGHAVLTLQLGQAADGPIGLAPRARQGSSTQAVPGTALAYLSCPGMVPGHSWHMGCPGHPGSLQPWPSEACPVDCCRAGQSLGKARAGVVPCQSLYNWTLGGAEHTYPIPTGGQRKQVICHRMGELRGFVGFPCGVRRGLVRWSPPCRGIGQSFPNGSQREGLPSPSPSEDEVYPRKNRAYPFTGLLGNSENVPPHRA